MQAMIFAAGMGTRLKPITDVMPKALVPVGDKPLIQHVMDKLNGAGVEHVVVNVHHKAGQIRNFLSLTEGKYDFTLSISDESEQLLETGGGIRFAQPLFSGSSPILIHNVDIISNVNLKTLYEKASGTDAMLLVSQRQTKRYLLFNEDMRLIGWTNIGTGEVKSPFEDIRSLAGEEFQQTSCRAVEQEKYEFDINDKHFRLYAFSGIHIFSPTLFPDMNDWPEKFPIIDFYLNRCAERIIKGHLKKDLKLLDVGKLDSLADAEEFVKGIH